MCCKYLFIKKNKPKQKIKTNETNSKIKKIIELSKHKL